MFGSGKKVKSKGGGGENSRKVRSVFRIDRLVQIFQVGQCRHQARHGGFALYRNVRPWRYQSKGEGRA